ncbi:response regulator [Nodosilinea sp. FACHB-131]|uniref:response regulator n=1 Tax=Cyanophyceae TaxID=3028117 RepID=UPI0016895F11|nr:response regulator [Nodosilinea sp. FACHB-131]MBD1874738.1 response regulator [Nodosilinea sp. FACHB-131]
MSDSSQALSNPGLLKDVQILVVDNDADSRYLYKVLFEICGAQVTPVESIADAIALLDDLVPDILICESSFFNEDTSSLVQRIRAVALDRERTIPILVVSAYYLAKFVQKMFPVVEDCLLKPIDVEKLVDEVWNLVRLAKSTEKAGIQDWVIKHRDRAKQLTASV